MEPRISSYIDDDRDVITALDAQSIADAFLRDNFQREALDDENDYIWEEWKRANAAELAWMVRWAERKAANPC